MSTLRHAGSHLHGRHDNVGLEADGSVRSSRAAGADLRKAYDFALSGSYNPMVPGDVPATLNAKGLLRADASGDFILTRQGNLSGTTQASVTLDSDCIVHLELALPNEDNDTNTLITLRGIVVDEAKEILAIRTDPGWMVSAKFTAHE